MYVTLSHPSLYVFFARTRIAHGLVPRIVVVVSINVVTAVVTETKIMTAREEARVMTVLRR